MKDDQIVDYERRPPRPEQAQGQWSPLTVSILAALFAGVTCLGGARRRSLQERYDVLQFCILPSIACFLAALHRASREVWRGRTNPQNHCRFWILRALLDCDQSVSGHLRK
jgi:hypothetical protein